MNNPITELLNQQTLRILYLEDVISDGELVGDILKEENFDVEMRLARNRKEYLEAIEAYEPHLILADYTLPTFDGLEALEIAKKLVPQIPFIFVTGSLGEERAVEAMQRGAVDFVVKQNLSRLSPAVMRAIREAEEKTARKQIEAHIQSIFESTTEAIFSVNLNRELTAFNSVFARFFAELYQTNPQVGGKLLDFIPEKEHCSWLNCTHKAQTTGTCNLDYVYQVDASITRYFEISSHSINDGEFIIGASFFMKDVTDQRLEEIKNAALEAQKIKDQLEKERQNKIILMAGQEKERKRISKELHDGVGQILTSLSMQVAGAKAFLHRKEYEQLQPILESTQHTLNGLIAEMREISQNLSPRILNDHGLSIALERLKDELCKNQEIENVNLVVLSQDDRFAPELEIQIYRIVQELTNNISKHASATEVDIQFIQHESYIQLIVEDNGVGFQLNQDSMNGLGLYNLQERVAILNGSLNIDSTIEKGTTVIVEIPT